MDNTYLTLYLPIPTDHEGREGWEQDSATIRLNKALEKAGNQQQAASNWSATISKAIDPQRSACKVTQSKVGHEAQHAPWDPLQVMYAKEGETTDCIGSRLTLPKSH